MKELIKEAEKLYEEIDTIQMLWVASTKDNDEEGIRYAIGRMSVAMCSAMQLLKCFIDRKDNIVDLGKVWKDGNHIPRKDKKVVVVNDNGKVIGGYLFVDKYSFTVNIDPFHAITSDISNLYRWAYLHDLLPKGGE